MYVSSRGISTCDAFAMRPRHKTPLRKVKEVHMYDVATIRTDVVNGWSNRETWLANLWLTNDEYSYSVLMQATERKGEPYEKAYWLEHRLRDQLDCELEVASLWQDLLRTAFDRINWVEVIESNTEEVR